MLLASIWVSPLPYRGNFHENYCWTLWVGKSKGNNVGIWISIFANYWIVSARRVLLQYLWSTHELDELFKGWHKEGSGTNELYSLWSVLLRSNSALLCPSLQVSHFGSCWQILNKRISENGVYQKNNIHHSFWDWVKQHFWFW